MTRLILAATLGLVAGAVPGLWIASRALAQTAQFSRAWQDELSCEQASQEAQIALQSSTAMQLDPAGYATHNGWTK